MPYRDSKEALQGRRDALKQESTRLAERRKELSGVAEREASVQRELFDLEAQLQGLKPQDDPDLDAVKIASPCNADWAAMKGDDRSRYCSKCEKNVYNLSTMTRDEAASLIEEKEGKLCVRFFVREDGTMLTADCPVGLRKKRVRLAIYGAAAGAGLLATTSFALVGGPRVAQGELEARAVTNVHDPSIEIEARPQPTMGEMSAPRRTDVEEETQIPVRQGHVTPPTNLPRMGAIAAPLPRTEKPFLDSRKRVHLL